MGRSLYERARPTTLFKEETQVALRVSHVVVHHLQQVVVRVRRQSRCRILRLTSPLHTYDDRNELYESLGTERLHAEAQRLRENHLEAARERFLRLLRGVSLHGGVVNGHQLLEKRSERRLRHRSEDPNHSGDRRKKERPGVLEAELQRFHEDGDDLLDGVFGEVLV